MEISFGNELPTKQLFSQSRLTERETIMFKKKCTGIDKSMNSLDYT